jgi:hypothetical protein
MIAQQGDIGHDPQGNQVEVLVGRSSTRLLAQRLGQLVSHAHAGQGCQGMIQWEQLRVHHGIGPRERRRLPRR